MILECRRDEQSKGRTMNFQTMTPTQLYDLFQAGKPIELIDVRTPVEFREVHIPFARNEPLDRLDISDIGARHLPADPPLFIVCRSGARGKQCCERFLADGCANVVNIEGGTLAWESLGLPVERGPKAISLERQVRIAAGTLVLLGTTLGYLIHSYWLGLPAIVGAGLVFAGITDTCGMGLLLARMPWNKISPVANRTIPR